MEQPLDILQRYWGYSAFRPLQEEIIQSVLDGTDTLAILPTGGGKSICFQIPALCLEGICLVVSPLIALMKDQVEHLKQREIKAAAIFSGMSKREIDITLDNCIYGQTKFLYVSPERLKTGLFMERALQMKTSLLVIDEAHCISQWGYDFRPPYLEIAEFRKSLDIPRLVALTATATKEVKEDIASKLEIENVAIFQKSPVRENLSYSVFQLENKEQKMLEILKNVHGASIVYVRSRKRTQEVAHSLIRLGISADFYHAGLPPKARSEKQDQWINNHTRVMVATNAFGMGIDKPDVRTVIHLDLPDSLEAYYQEAGRAGRDEKKAYAVALFHHQSIVELKERSEQSTVTLDELKKTYQALANYYKLAVGSISFSSNDFHLGSFVKTYNLPPKPTFLALKKLSDEGLIQLGDGFFGLSRLGFLSDKKQVYEYQVANPKLDPLIKTILRLSGGKVFRNYVTVKEHELARLTKNSEVQVRNWLTYLNQQGVIDYQPSSDSQQLSFLTPRLDPEKLPIDEKQLEWRRKLAVEKAKAVIDYIKSNNCRTNIFQHYFDEKPKDVCGICDNDLEKKHSRRANLKTKEVMDVLSVSKTISDLRKLFAKHPEKQLTDTLRILLEDGKVKEEGGSFQTISIASK